VHGLDSATDARADERRAYVKNAHLLQRCVFSPNGTFRFIQSGNSAVRSPARVIALFIPDLPPGLTDGGIRNIRDLLRDRPFTEMPLKSSQRGVTREIRFKTIILIISANRSSALSTQADGSRGRESSLEEETSLTSNPLLGQRVLRGFKHFGYYQGRK